jgi:hypothetical protein
LAVTIRTSTEMSLPVFSQKSVSRHQGFIDRAELVDGLPGPEAPRFRAILISRQLRPPVWHVGKGRRSGTDQRRSFDSLTSNIRKTPQYTRSRRRVRKSPTAMPSMSSSDGTALNLGLAFNRTVVLRYRFFLEQRNLAPSTINVRLAAIRRLVYEASDSGLLSPELAAGIRRVKGAKRLGTRIGNWLTADQCRSLLRPLSDGLRGKRDRARRVSRPTCRRPANLRRALGGSRLDRQGKACANGSDAELGETRGGRLDKKLQGYRATLLSDSQDRSRVTP